MKAIKDVLTDVLFILRIPSREGLILLRRAIFRPSCLSAVFCGPLVCGAGARPDFGAAEASERRFHHLERGRMSALSFEAARRYNINKNIYITASQA
jgi:hypothetical protein